MLAEEGSRYLRQETFDLFQKSILIGIFDCNRLNTAIPDVSKGKIRLSGSKHVALRCLVASLLTDKRVEIDNFPHELIDAQSSIALLTSLGKVTEREGNQLIIQGKPDRSYEGRHSE